MLDESLIVLLVLVDIAEVSLCVIVLSEINDDGGDDDVSFTFASFLRQFSIFIPLSFATHHFFN